MVGAGRVGSNIPYAYLAALPIKEIEVWDRTASNAERLVADLKANGITAANSNDLEAAVGRADVISCAYAGARTDPHGGLAEAGVSMSI